MRTNIVLDRELVEKAMKLSTSKTIKALVHEALVEYVKKQEIRNMARFRGSDLWEGDLEQMRSTISYETY